VSRRAVGVADLGMSGGATEPGVDFRTLADCEAFLDKIPDVKAILPRAFDFVDSLSVSLEAENPNLVSLVLAANINACLP
jgi:hypothetical protein